jgi:catechol 2,3-dioxygenase-like lactoylglutathione lyase family enzyme
VIGTRLEALRMQHVLGLDHVIILVRDLDDADGRMARLGFRPTPRGYHSAHMGTANATVMLRNGTYFETLTVTHETPANEATRAVLAEREGPFGLAFKTDDAGGAAAEFEAAGIAVGGALDFVRPVTLPGGTRDARFTVARTRTDATPGAMLFVCQHHTPDVVWREGYLNHPNDALGLAEVIGVADDLAGIEQAYRTIFGDRVRRTDDRVGIAAGDASITFLAPDAFDRRFGVLGEAVSSPRPRLAGSRIQVRTFDAIEHVLLQNGVPWARGYEQSMLVASDAGCGTLFEFAL